MSTAAPTLGPQLAVPGRLLRLRSDATLAERFAAGDEAAFAVLYERHRPTVLAVCMGVLGSSHDAEDAAQEAFASLAAALRNAPPRELRAWLTRVARNAAIDLARRRRRTVLGGDSLPDRPGGTVDGRAELESVLAGIRELPEGQRTALLMRELAGHSYQEIAALLETDEEAVRGLIARARVSLRAHREASELSCAAARATLATDPAVRAQDRAIRRHLRGCAGCRAYRRALRDDARVLRGLNAMPAAATSMAGSSAVVGGLAAKGALLGGALTQVTAACAVSACAVGGVVLLAPQTQPARHAHAARAHSTPHRRAVAASASVAASGQTATVHRHTPAPVARTPTAASPASSAAGRSGGPRGASTSRHHGQGSDAVGHGRSRLGGAAGRVRGTGSPEANRLGSAPAAPAAPFGGRGGTSLAGTAPAGASAPQAPGETMSGQPTGFGGSSSGAQPPLSSGGTPYAPTWHEAPTSYDSYGGYGAPTGGGSGPDGYGSGSTSGWSGYGSATSGSRAYWGR